MCSEMTTSAAGMMIRMVLKSNLGTYTVGVASTGAAATPAKFTAPRTMDTA